MGWENLPQFLEEMGRPLVPFVFPAGRHPFPNQAFVQAGGEIIFHLPNGLQGYLLVDGQNQRIDEGPIQVVGDALKTSGTPAIVTGVSCMACHKQGMIPFTDSIRDGSAVFGVADQKVKDLYPPARVMNRLIERDQQRFLQASDQAIGPFLRTGLDKGRPAADFPSPMGEVARTYRRGFLDLRAVASELDVEKPEDLPRRVGVKKLKQLGLEAPAQDKGVVGRLEWEAVDGISLMQELARELGTTPFGK